MRADLPRAATRSKRLPRAASSGKGKRRREELVTKPLPACTATSATSNTSSGIRETKSKVQIIDEFTGRVMTDRSWQHGLHQAIEVKEKAQVTADKENLARLSFQRFFRQYPIMCGMTGTAWEAAPELWQIYQRPIVRIPTNRPCIRVQLPTRMFETTDEKWEAVVERVAELHKKGVPVLIGTRSVLAAEEVSRRLSQAGSAAPRAQRHADRTGSRRSSPRRASTGRSPSPPTWPAAAPTSSSPRASRDLGGLHVIATEPHSSHRVDRQLFGRAARQGDPGCARCSPAPKTTCSSATPLASASVAHHRPRQLIKIAQARAERLARFSRKQVLKNDDWMDQSLPF